MKFWKTNQEAGESLEVGVPEVAAALEENTHTILDVRELNEWHEAHIDGAVHIPLGDIQARANELPQDVPVYTVCHSGARSLYAVEMLKHLGFAESKSLAGGMVAWARAGKPMVR